MMPNPFSLEASQLGEAPCPARSRRALPACTAAPSPQRRTKGTPRALVALVAAAVGCTASVQPQHTDRGAEYGAPYDAGGDGDHDSGADRGTPDATTGRTDSSQAADTGSACLSTEAQIVSTLSGGADAVLCPGAVIAVHQKLVLRADHQQIYTQGFPRDSTRATLTIDPSATALDAIIESQPSAGSPAPLRGLAVRSLILDGNARMMGKLDDCPSSADGCHGLVNLGNVVGPRVQDNDMSYARTWSHLVLTTNGGGCSGALVSANHIGPSTPAEDNHYTDGISVNCASSTVSDNTITDVSDGAIVVFAQQDVKVSNNTISADSVHMNLAIGLTDYIQGCGNYSGSTVSGNTITSLGTHGGFIYVGIASGNHLWFGAAYDSPPSPCTQRYNQAAVVRGNTLSGRAIGIGIPVSGVSGFIISDNALGESSMLVDPTTVESSTLQAGASSVKPGALDGVIGHAFWVYRLYENFLDRSSDGAGFAFWLAATYPCTNARLLAITQGFLVDVETTAHLATRTAAQVAASVYRAVLDRAPDAASLPWATSVIESGASHAAGAASLALTLYESAEYSDLSRNGAICPYSLGN